MQVSLAWLREILGPEIGRRAGLDVAVTASGDPAAANMTAGRELAWRIRRAGVEVEAVSPAAPPLLGVIVGEVLSVTRHAKADTLTVCKVATGREMLQVVCGAPNVRPGMKAPFAIVGATLP